MQGKGDFPKEKLKPLVGDYVEIEVLDQEHRTGNIINVLPRENMLIRPAVANIDQALVIFAAKDPKPNFSLLDRFLVTMERQEIPVLICINKQDLADEEEAQKIRDCYEACGYQVLFTSASKGEGIEELKQCLQRKTTTVAGPLRSGKILSYKFLAPGIDMETGEISKKLGRGRHTTRLLGSVEISGDTYLMDTPGFTSFYVETWRRKNCGTISRNSRNMRDSAGFGLHPYP